METPGKIHLGTCAWSFEDWRGPFYPPHMPQNQWLEFYARHFNCVEVDSTFYAVPTASTVEQWHARTPAHFRFCCKLPREITHEQRLRDCAPQLTEFLNRVEILGEKLGPLVIQLPPSFQPARDEEALRTFIAQLPTWPRFAVEFRDPGWSAPRITELLVRRGICQVWNDMTALEEQGTAAFGLLPEPTDLLYVRLLGDLGKKYGADGETIHRYGSLLWPREESLENWTLKIQRHVEESAAIYVLCANHFEGSAPLTAKRLAARLGLPEIDLPPAEPAQLDLWG